MNRVDIELNAISVVNDGRFSFFHTQLRTEFFSVAAANLIQTDSKAPSGARLFEFSLGKSWCRRRDSNPHVLLGTQDFKSCASAISPLRQPVLFCLGA